MRRTESGNEKSKSSTDVAARGGYVMCIDNDGYEASLEVTKVYRAIPNRRSGPPRGWYRVVDESGEDYLFPPDMFVPIMVPPRGRRAFAGTK